ncbi:MAG TPA: M56 family metallopeptidase [Thermoguttaceae bacterium]|nr:M56 family metallopeptidase [Thermoguttaceae bacterium]
MHSSLPLEYGLWLVPIIVLSVGTAVIVGLAAIAARWARSAAWQRTIWQATTLGLFALLVVELTGGGSAFVQLLRTRAGPTDAETRPAPMTFAAPRSQTSGQEESAAPEPSLGDVVAPGQAAQIALAPPPFPDERQPPIAVAGLLDADRPAMVGTDVAESAASAETGLDPPPLPVSVPFAPAHVVEPEVEVNEPAPSQSSPDGLVVTAFMRSEILPSDLPSVPPSEAPSDPMSRVTTSRAACRPEMGGASGWWPAVIWALGAAAIAGRFVWARLLLVAFRRRHAVVRDEALCRRVAALARRQGIRGPVTVMEAAGLTAPVAFGIFRPTVALPTTFCDEFDPPQQEAMLVHEVAHLAGRDPGWQLAADLVCATLWWHPLCWWSRRRLREAGEAAADEASLLVPDGPDLLASSLLVLGQRLAGVRPRLGWLSAGGLDFRSGLGRRVERLLSLSGRSPQAPGRARLAVAKTALPVALVIVAVLSTAWAHPQVALGEGGTTMNVLKTSWRRSLAAAAVAAMLIPISGDVMSQEEGDRPVAARRDRQRPERGERPGGEREFLRHQIEVLRLAMNALREAERGDAVELVERAIRAAEVTLEGRRDDEARQIREHAPPPPELAEILGMAADLWRKFDKPEKAEEVARLAEAVRAPRDRDRDRERGEREGREERRREPREVIPSLQREFDELAEKAHRIERELGELGDGQDEKARELQGALAGTRERMEQVERQLAEAARDRPHRETRDREPAEREREMAERQRHELARRADELMEAHERAAREGRPEEAERLLREAEEIRRDLERRPDRDRPDGPPPEEREEMERRVHHVRVAVENLHAAGLHEQAEQLAGQMERLLHGRPEPPRDRPREVDAPPRGEGRPHPEQLEGVLRELNGAIGQLNERMEALTVGVEDRIREVRHGMEQMSRETGETSRQLNQRSENLEREIRTIEARLRELKDRDDDEDDDKDADDDDKDDDDR